ncbi:hypothetical protein SUDANB105_07780 [Streptomyces sp. enrichment culture]|uniref:hypothetical protein n=1 Tax=Streptomyces sp. enrichment culture TaxID=1795815 RepID=UPI003F542A56
MLAGERLPEAWLEEITAPGHDDEDEDEQRTYTRLLTAISDFFCDRDHRNPYPPYSPVPLAVTAPVLM